MPKLRVELDGPHLTEVVILRDGQPLTHVASLAVHLDAESRDQILSLTTMRAVDGQHLLRSDQAHTITKATLSIDYEEA